MDVSPVLTALGQLADCVIAGFDANGEPTFGVVDFERRFVLPRHRVPAAPWFLGYLGAFDPLQEQATATAFGNGLRGGRTFVTNFRLRYDEREWRAIEATTSPVSSEHGQTTQWLTILRDITGELPVHRETRNAQRSEMQGLLAVGVAHDLGNLLSSVLCSAELAEMLANTPPAALREIQTIKRTAGRAIDLSRLLLKKRYRPSMNDGVINVGDTLRELELLFRPMLPVNATLRIETVSQPVFVRGSQVHFEQAVFNLVSNARDSLVAKQKRLGQMPGDDPDAYAIGVTMEVTAAPREEGRALWDRLPDAGPYVRVSVLDSGEGMEERMLQRITTPFFSTKSRQGDRGVGMSIVTDFLDETEGALLVSSTEGVGTAARLVLPCEASSADSLAGVSDRMPTGRERILLLERDALSLDTMTRLLTELGYTVTTAASVRPLLNREIDLVPNLLIADIVTLGAGGENPFRRLCERFPELPVLLVTLDETGDAIGLENETDGGVHLRRPFTPIELAVAVRRALDRSPRSTPW
ncbi:ATP-binding protein [Gemmatimonas sp.]|jgi:two-component system cell cycle sensor histidine kinase/response regulator CckA|uniref:ATP-binding protein n=1 Tax=Gemmatimonas sp. TaxID=1962908 RepID=UPI0037C18D5A